MNIVNLSIIRQTFANTVFNHQVQEIAAERQGNRAFVIKIVNLLLVLIVLIMLVAQVSKPDDVVYSYIGVALTIIEIIFMIFQLLFNFENNKQQHKNSALKFMGLRDNYRSLIADVMSESIGINEIKSRRDSLQKEYQTICEFSPQTGLFEYCETQKRLNTRGRVEGENFTWSDNEIDRFLPEKLRLKVIKIKS